LRKIGVPTLIIRPASPDHVDAIFSSLLGIARQVKEEHKVRSTRDDLERALFGPQPILGGVVAEIDEEYAGMCLFFRSYSTWLGHPGVYIQDLWVEEAARKKRVGERLLQHVAALTRTRGGVYMRLSVDTQNFQAMRFYERLGLAHSDTEQVHAAYDDAFQALADGATR
jgi:ribosomal protein S18 acetylase RimI-like enzyme